VTAQTLRNMADVQARWAKRFDSCCFSLKNLTKSPRRSNRSGIFGQDALRGRSRSLTGGATMTNDAKLGLVVGISVVILIAIVFYRKDPALAHASPDAKAPAQVQSAGIARVPPVTEPLALTSATPEPPVPTPLEPESPGPAAPKARSR
jgi:hypothetical protein